MQDIINTPTGTPTSFKFRFQSTLASSAYLTGISLQLTNALVQTRDTRFISFLAQSQPVPVGDTFIYRTAAEAADFSGAVLESVIQLALDQGAARHELEFPAPLPWFSKSHSQYKQLSDIWTSAARSARDAIEQANLHLDDGAIGRGDGGWLAGRFEACRNILNEGLRGQIPSNLSDPLSALPAWVQRRQFRRIKTSLPVNLWIRDRRMQARAQDLSQAGAMLEAVATVTRGESVLVELPNSPLRKAIVRWALFPRFGIEFTEKLSPQDLLLLETSRPAGERAQ